MIDENRLKAHMNNGELEYIMCAAIWCIDDIDYIHKPYNIDKGIVFSGWRHPQIFETIPYKYKDVHKFEQGFLTNKNRFLTRKEGLELVKANGQLKKELIGSVLTSEDLW